MNPVNEAKLEELQEQLERKLSITEEKDKRILTDDLNDCMAMVLDYCNRNVLVGNMANAVKELLIVKYNRAGTEGETARSEGGISQTFETGLPQAIKAQLNRYRVAKVRKFL
ncbi:phage head-tail connector protein [Enterococcus sp. DIV1420a]|uniref:phage head-tail connector protein n=1 Tax=Enterococcus sp. DIV1420a TaxID=2774672 RepID=UPI0036D53A3D